MYVLIREKMAPPLAFVLLPLIAAVCAGFGFEDISGFIKTGMNTVSYTHLIEKTRSPYEGQRTTVY